jgi:hypothetical protein
MPYSVVRAEASLDALWSTVTKVRFFTASYALQLSETAITFAAADTSGNTVTTSGNSLPIDDTWDEDGTVAAVRFLDASNVVILERSDANAVGTTGSGAFVELSSLTAADGGAFQITAAAITSDRRMEGES